MWQLPSVAYYQTACVLVMQANASTGKVEDEQPAWAPLRDNYMLTSSKLKDWDKMPVRIFCNKLIVMRCTCS